MRLMLASVFVTLAAAAAAQAPAPASVAGASAASPAGQPAASAPANVPEPYAYDAAGRRDPFINLLNTGIDPHAQSGRRPDGPAGVAAAELSVNGVLQSRGKLVAMITGIDKRSYVVHAGDKLYDGVVKTVTTEGLVIVQDVNDPLSPVKKREVRKLLRSLEDAKE
jgi:Tfp pilus assembly protein PilP